jgi:hypothetical protein
MVLSKESWNRDFRVKKEAPLSARFQLEEELLIVTGEIGRAKKRSVLLCEHRLLICRKKKTGAIILNNIDLDDLLLVPFRGVLMTKLLYGYTGAAWGAMARRTLTGGHCCSKSS